MLNRSGADAAMDEDHTICVVGLGYVGLPTAALFARSGLQVEGVDIDPEIVSRLSRGESSIQEPGVEEIVVASLASGRLHARMTPPDEADVFVICVPTPVDASHRADMAFVLSAAHSIVPRLRRGNLIILQSTSPIGSTRMIAELVRTAGFDPYDDLDICYCPERVFPGHTLDEMINNSRVIGGCTERAGQRALELYKRFSLGALVVTSSEAAEFAKLMENTYRDVNIALANVFARIAEEDGIDGMEAIRVANMHPRVNIHAPGAGVGGHCIPVDPWFLIEKYREFTPLLLAARTVNDSQPVRLLDRAERAGLRPENGRVAILGVAYRGDIDDAREAPSEQLAKELSLRGYHWEAHDPHVGIWKTHEGNHRVNPDLGEVLAGAGSIFLMTDHTAYRSLTTDALDGFRGRLIVDGRNMLDPRPFEAQGFVVIQVGRPTPQAAIAAPEAAEPSAELLAGGAPT